MRRALIACLVTIALAPAAHAATQGRALVRQLADADRQRPAAEAEFALGKALAYTTEFVGDAYYQVAMFPADVDLSGAAQATDVARWVEDAIKSRKLKAVVVTIEPDGDAQNMNVYADGKIELGASGTMGTIYGLALNGDRLSGHYVYLSDLFGNPVAIDASFDEPLWKAASGTALGAGGGAAGKAYLELIDAAKRGDYDAFVARSAEGGTREEFTEMLPMLKAMLPTDAKVTGGTGYPGRAVLVVDGKREGKPYAATVEMAERDGKWVRVSSNSGSGSGGAAAPPKIEGVPPDVLPALHKPGLVSTKLTLLEQPFTPKHAIAIRRPGGAETNPQVLVVLSETAMLPEHANALWSDAVPIAKLYRAGGPIRSMLLVFTEGEGGALSPEKGYTISNEGTFTEEFMLRGEAQRFGQRVIGQYLAQHYDEASSENVLDGAARFDLVVTDAKD
ncbi:MAG TPA: hypothetical protein VND91_09830 [Candidatus Saccharimonadia bacterium]|nr:hypothetical protein [Candidatus Saccharimonadia bacterium]